MKLNKVIKEFKKLGFQENLVLCGLKPGRSDLPDNPADFLLKFITEYNHKFMTVESETENLVTGTNRRRSIQETFSILKTYFPKYEIVQYFKDIYEVLYRIWVDKDFDIQGKVLGVSFCSDSKRPNFYFSSNKKNYYTGSYFDLFVKIPNKYFPFPIWWKQEKLERFWNFLFDEEIAFELLGEKYLLSPK